ncbi:MAG: hypothetical protein V1833_04825 [Elusimicrobiota bacterium]
MSFFDNVNESLKREIKYQLLGGSKGAGRFYDPGRALRDEVREQNKIMEKPQCKGKYIPY